MGQKANPKSFRLAYNHDWESLWYASKRDYPDNLNEDYKIRTFLLDKLRYASVSKVFIERAGNRIRVTIYTSRPGIVIGRKGQELEKLKEQVNRFTSKDIILDIQEINKPDIDANIVAQNVALQLERRISFRKAAKKQIQMSMSLGADGIRIRMSGRLGGTDIARSEWFHEGRIPAQTIRETIDYGFAEARTLYGIIGVKCWICKKPEDSNK